MHYRKQHPQVGVAYIWAGLKAGNCITIDPYAEQGTNREGLRIDE